MPSRINRRVLLVARPRTTPLTECFRIDEAAVSEPAEGQLLLRTLWLSLDPYMRGRMSDAPSYAPPAELGEPMLGATVSRVEVSRHASFAPGDLVLAMSGWQDYALSDGRGVTAIPAGTEHPSHALGVLGMPGFTAHFGLLDIGRPVAGETLVVAAATGAVGSVVGQIAKLKGCRVVGVAGGAEKCRWAVRELGIDDCLDHHSAALDTELAAACPQGIDIYFESVGGKVLRAVLPLLNAQARIPVCGLISQYQREEPDATHGLTLMRSILVKRLTLRGFIISEHYGARFAEFRAEMDAWLRSGRIRYREDVVHGLENAPQALLGLLEGRNFGKLVVQVAAQ